MALINCPECNKEVSDKAKNCIHCGYPLHESQPAQDASVPPRVEKIVKPTSAKKKKHQKKVIVRIAAIAGVLIVVVIMVYVFTIVIPNGKYKEALALLEDGKYSEADTLLNELGNYKDAQIVGKQIKYDNALALLERGKYEDANALLKTIDGYKDTQTIREQIKYESAAYNCINELKKVLKNPDSFSPYEINFYFGSEAEEGSKPVCVMHYGAQNGFGGNTTGYATFTYSDDTKQYSLYGHTDSLQKEDLERDKDDDDYYLKAITTATILVLRETGTEVGDIDMARLKVVLKNDAYSAIKIID